MATPLNYPVPLGSLGTRHKRRDIIIEKLGEVWEKRAKAGVLTLLAILNHNLPVSAVPQAGFGSKRRTRADNPCSLFSGPLSNALPEERDDR